MITDPSQWIKASASGDSGECVEMRRHEVSVEVRDTKGTRRRPRALALTPVAFTAWIDGAKKGQLDHLS